MKPGRRRVKGFVVQSITVDSRPRGDCPASRISEALLLKSSYACFASVALGFPALFAEGAAIGVPALSISACATGWEGILTATVLSPAVASLGTVFFLKSTKVRGPGQNFFARRKAIGGIFFATFFRS